MNYELQFDQNTIEFLQKLPKELRNRIFNKITSTKENPFRYFERLEGREEYKMRVGDYRIIVDIENNKIKIVLIGHRKNIYKMLP
jgi:mRNA interferase RelE/StbE